MFKETDHNKQLDLFGNVSMNLTGRASKKYDDPDAWHNQFYELVTSKVDEAVFRPLFKDGNMGAPTKGLCRIVAMMIYKEGCGCSDAELEQRVDFDLQLRRALGLFSLEDQAPSIDGYYSFRRRLVMYEAETGTDLYAECFRGLTAVQARKFNISGKSVRMDSKLIGSNIAWYPRYRLVHETLVKEVSKEMAAKLKGKVREQVVELLEENAKNTLYVSDSATIERRFEHMGRVIYAILVALKIQSGLLHRVFYEQYRLVKDKDGNGKERGPKYPEPKDKKDISAKSLQNPNDPDAEYRQKGDQRVKGYSTNITETTDDGDKPSLIVDVQVKGATAADNSYTRDAIGNAEAVTGDKVETLYADGAYQSPDNREFAEENGVEIITSGIQGKPTRYDLSLQGEELTVTDKVTGKSVAAERRGDKWRVKLGAGKNPYRYFTREQVDRDAERRRLASIPKERLDIRNNVEATIFQYCFHTRNNKTRYRGLAKHRMQAISRCAWMNLVRLCIFQLTILQRPLFAVIGFLRDSWEAFCRTCCPEVTFCGNFISMACSHAWSSYAKLNFKNLAF